MPRVLGADSMLNLMTWVDEVYAVHDDMRRNTRGAISFGIDVITCKPAK